MKTKNYFKKAGILLLVCAAQLITAQVPSYVPTNGLVGYWPFTGNANDISGNLHNGTVTGATLVADRFGNANSAYNFASTGQNINFFTDGTWCANNHSISIWFNSAYISGKDQFLLTKRTSCLSGSETHYFELRISPTSNILQIGWGGLPSTNGAYFSNISFTPNTWNNLVYVRNGADFYVYLNGTMVSTQNGNCPTISCSNMLKAGNHSCSVSNDDYIGKLDDIGIFNRALTQQEITSLYTGVPAYSNNCNAVSGSLTQGLVGYWPFCGNANDDSGHGNNGTVNGATLTADRFGNANAAYSFNGTSNFIEVPDNNLLDLSNNFTISLWMKISDYSVTLASDPQSTVLSKPRQSGMATGYCISAYYNLNLNKFSFNYNIGSSGGGQSSNTATPLNTWINVIYTYDGTTSKIYKNGVLESSSALTYVLPNFPTSLFFGKEFDNTSTSKRFFKGLIDDIGIWNRALTTQEVTQLYNQNQCFTNTTVTDTLVINVGQMGFNPVTYANNITIYPNPASTQVNISFNTIADLNGGTIKIINSLGQQVATTSITATGTNTTMTLSSWGGAGLYFVQIVNPQGQIVDIKKILLQ